MSARVVRVQGGAQKGRRLKGAAPGTRPATALLRAAIFNRPDVQARLPGRVLDLYAGAGFLGVEALSRGAEAVDFVERDRAACLVIRANVAAVGAQRRARVLCTDVGRARRRLRPPYDLCFADPPYAVDAHATLEALAAEVVAPEGLLLWRLPDRRAAPERLGPLARTDLRRYGEAALATYAWEGAL